MAYETIMTRTEGPAFIITLNRPDKRNAINTIAMGEIIAAAAEAEADKAVRGIIITGGDRFFSAGADLNEAQALSSPSESVTYMRRWHRVTRALEENAKPVLAAIEGFCMTGGCELALACDIRIGAEGSSYAITSSRIGTVAGAGGTQRLPRVVGQARALEILFAAEPIDAAEAYRIGLINKLTPKGGSLAEAKKLVDLYATRAPLSHAFVKRVVYSGIQMDLTTALDFESFVSASSFQTADRKEGIGAFLEKRPAKFQGR